MTRVFQPINWMLDKVISLKELLILIGILTAWMYDYLPDWSWIPISIILGIRLLGALLLEVQERFFPQQDIEEEEEEDPLTTIPVAPEISQMGILVLAIIAWGIYAFWQGSDSLFFCVISNFAAFLGLLTTMALGVMIFVRQPTMAA